PPASLARIAVTSSVVSLNPRSAASGLDCSRRRNAASLIARWMTFSRFLLDFAAPSFIVLGRTMSLRRHLLRLVALYHSRYVIYLTFPLPLKAPTPYSSSGI